MAADSLGQARDAFAARAWRQAHARFEEARREGGKLTLDDFEHAAIAAHLCAEGAATHDALAEGYREALRLREGPRAARFAFWLGQCLWFEGRRSEASGWFIRARQIVSGHGAECPEGGYLLIPEGMDQMEAGAAEDAAALFAEARAIATRCGDLNLLAMAGHGLGRALVRAGRVAEGMGVLDEVMVAVTAGEVSPMVVGDVYCGVLEACHEVLDVRRAREWTGALTRWCEGQPDLVPHRGPCLVYRAEVMQFHGAWSDALEEARRACEWLSLPISPEGPAEAFYRLGELHRLRGGYDEADGAYRQASRLGRRTEPGLPLLWLARGQAEAARAAIRRALEEETEPARRAALLDAAVDIALAGDDGHVARAAAQELRVVADVLGTAAVRALADRAEGATLLAAGDATTALAPLRRAWSAWQRLEAPYDAARVRVLIGRAYHALGDRESAAMEFDAARWVFEQLGAAPDLTRLDALAAADEAVDLPGGLTAREVDVLRLVAAGQTNREIGAALVISEHTVARHVQNMLAKLGHSSRTALAAFAVEHGIAPAGSSQG